MDISNATSCSLSLQDMIDRLKVGTEDNKPPVAAAPGANEIPTMKGLASRPTQPVERIYHLDAYHRSESTELSLTTQDGDTITFDFYSDYLKHSEFESLSGPGMEHARALEIEAYSVGVSYSVQGEIDAEEEVAIREVMTQIEEIADLFFSGQQEQALEKATTFSFDTNEIEDVNALFRQQEAQTAISEFEKIENLPMPESDTPQLGKGEQQSAALVYAGYMQELLNTLAPDNQTLPESGSNDQTILEDLTELLEEFSEKISERLAEPLSKFYQNSEDMVQSVVKQLFNAHPAFGDIE